MFLAPGPNLFAAQYLAIRATLIEVQFVCIYVAEGLDAFYSDF